MGVFIQIAGSPAADTINLNALPDPGAGNGYFLSALGGNDTVTGRTEANRPDVIDAGAGNDLVNANAGNDTVRGGGGKDTLNGDAGNDSISGGADNDSIRGGDNNDTLRGDAGNDTVRGDAGNDNIGGGTENDLLNGGTGNDTVNGDDGNDSLRGDGGNDRLNGGKGNDVLEGGGDNDILNGGAGNDSMLGGTGRDAFVFDTDNTDNTATSAPEQDTIFDFNTNHDVIDLRAFNIGTGQVKIDNPVVGAFQQSTRTIWVDTDGDRNFTDNLIIKVLVTNPLGFIDSLDVFEWPFTSLPSGEPEIIV